MSVNFGVCNRKYQPCCCQEETEHKTDATQSWELRPLQYYSHWLTESLAGNGTVNTTIY